MSLDLSSDLTAPSDGARCVEPPAFRLRNLRAQILKQSIFQGVDLEVRPRRTTVILGPGGSGKSTLLRVLAEAAPAADDLVMPDEQGTGELQLPPPLKWDGDCDSALKSAHFMTQRHSLRSRLVVLELATSWRLPHDLNGIEATRSRAAQVWREVPGAWDYLRPLMHKNFSELSAGQRRLVDLTLVAAGAPDGLLLDEPTAEQELSQEDLVVRLLQSLRGSCTLVVVTHNLRVARLLADDLVLFIGGEVAESGPLQRVLNEPSHPRTEYFLRMGC